MADCSWAVVKSMITINILSIIWIKLLLVSTSYDYMYGHEYAHNTPTDRVPNMASLANSSRISSI